MKPSVLYRGIVISCDQLEKFDFSSDLVVPYAPLIDEQGRKTDISGNEYGVYMSDNKQMVNDIYSNDHSEGQEISREITIGNDRRRICIPNIGIAYEIDSTGVDVRKPWIKTLLQGDSYNNNYSGDEWIADKIPASNYRVYRIRMGADILHETEDIPIIDGNVEQAQITAIQTMQMRKYRLNSLVNELSKMTPTQRLYLGYSELSVLKSIYGTDGVRYTNPNSIDTSNNIGRIKHLMVTFYNKGNGTIDFTTLGYVEGLKQKLAKSENPNLTETLEQIIAEDIKTNEDKKNAFVQRKTEEGVEFSTNAFDKKTEMMSEILSALSTTNEKKDNEDRDFDERQVEMENPNLQHIKPKHPKIKSSIINEKTMEREMQIKRAFEYQRVLKLEQQKSYEEEQDHGMSM